MTDKPAGAGKSSIDLVDWEHTVQLLSLESGDHFLDLACGLGRYSLAVADLVGATGRVHAVDLWAEGLIQLQDQARTQDIHWIKTYSADISECLPFADGAVDSCLIATALHDIPAHKRCTVVAEVFRVLKPGGLMTVIEFKQQLSGPPGPPADIRISVEDIEALAAPIGFKFGAVADVGAYVYLCQFRKSV
jgi:ubiquinone/menaquinone biosynthesis C-methylase UbiE